ncbi:hypothetical protein GPECTOR_57g462 [Gonium pectorale]|uniref:G-patch domain-containing protein n=1 Tax=Gonium pectorale TaxID=33097 RepID=A0A150G5P4_GONPE|nr:hypothetical protein GPECTOR_57g462 [Gonium pectorale]|eukprot:KXZ45172.1 hypothetical protein GPECTOR_57g462 [Gonium pectorale]
MSANQQPAGVNTLTPLGVAVVDPRLAAPRGDEFTNAFVISRQRGLDDDDDWARRPTADADAHEEEPGSSAAPISSSNIGFKLLQKMGWKEGKGLGKQEDGRVEPVASGIEAGVRLGLGKQEEDDTHTAEATAARKRLEIEVAAQEDEEAARRREAVAEVLQKREEDVKEMLQTFYCEVCDKQYVSARQLEEHLSSYDHHHRKRLAETKAAMAERNRSDRQRREQKVADKEMARLRKAGISFGLGGGGPGRGGLAAGRGGALARGGIKRPGAPVGLGGRPGKAAAVPMAGFGLDSDDEEGS